MAYPTTPRTWVAGDVLTAAQLNSELRDAFLGAFPLGPPDTPWTTYTPTLTQTGAVTKTATYARYQRVGRLIVAQVDLAITGPGTAGAAVLVGLPVPAAASGVVVGSGRIIDISAGFNYKAVVQLLSTTTVHFLGTMSTNGNALGIADFTAALASGDLVSASVMYESAA